jgi:hypothetical protein
MSLSRRLGIAIASDRQQADSDATTAVKKRLVATYAARVQWPALVRRASSSHREINLLSNC